MSWHGDSSRHATAGRQGGKKGKKHFETLPKEKLKELASNAGKRSVEARRAKKLAKE